MKKRILSLVIFFAMIAVLIPAITMAENTDNETVTLIVEVKGDAALETAEAVLMGAAEYNETDAAAQYMSRIMSVQEGVQSNIKRTVNKKANVGFTYTNVLNGFSVTVNKSDIDKIKALPNVKDVHISRKHKYIKPIENNNSDNLKFSDTETEMSDPALISDTDSENEVSIDTCCEMINLQYMHEHGYKGQGQAIAVIDTELDVNHEMFTSPIENPKYSKRGIADVIENNKLNVTAYPNQVWRSDKIPFAYNYSSQNADVYASDWSVTHGTHVCGIAAGKNGFLPGEIDGEYVQGPQFSSVAPEAQIIFMGVSDEGEYLSDDSIMAAMDDATKFDIAAINMSFGDEYIFFDDDGIYEKAINTAVDAGIMVSAAAGNSSMGYSSSSTPPEMIDVATTGLPANLGAATAVASVDNKMLWFIDTDGKLKHEVLNASGITLSSFSSYGTDVSLELKPEITTPGGFIWSARPDLYSVEPGEPDEYDYGDAYGTSSGTSMAAPHMTGAAALMRQYIEANYQGKYENAAKFIENLTMSSAKLIRHYNSSPPYSPRCQGAGLLDLEAAAKTPVILLSDNGKTKISLKDELTNTFEIEFTAKNFTDTDVTYDTITPYVETDDITGGHIYKYVSYKLDFNSLDMPKSITVPANGETTVKFTINLLNPPVKYWNDEKNDIDYIGQIDLKSKRFPNGFFLDGFIELSDSSAAIPNISIPYTGFHGDWTDAPAFDKPFYQRGRLCSYWIDNKTNPPYGYTALYSSDKKCDCLGEKSPGKCRQLGINKFVINTYFPSTGNVEDYAAEDFAGISPNGDGDFDFLCVSVVPERTMSGCNVRIVNSDGEIVRKSEDTNRNYEKYLMNCTDFEMKDLPDGDYTVYVTGHVAYEGAKDEEISMRFYIDTVVPEITKKEIRKGVDEEGNTKTYLDVSMSDNRYIMGAVAEGKKEDGTNFKKSMYAKAYKTGTASIDITDADISTLKVTAMDYARNKTEYNVIDEPSPSPLATPSISPSPSPTPTVTPTPSPTPTATVEPTESPSPTPTSSITPSPTPTPTPTPRTGDRVEFKRIDNVILAKLIFEETTPPAENDTWLIVAYRKDGELKRVEMPQVTDMTAGFVIPEKYKDCDIEVYVWDKNMKPLMSVQKVDI